MILFGIIQRQSTKAISGILDTERDINIEWLLFCFCFLGGTFFFVASLIYIPNKAPTGRGEGLLVGGMGIKMDIPRRNTLTFGMGCSCAYLKSEI